MPVRISRRGTIRMGLFGGDKKKNKKEQEAEGRRTGSQRRSRRIVTPGGKAASGSGSGSRRPMSSAVVRQRGRPQGADGAAPEQEQEKEKRPASAVPSPAPPSPEPAQQGEQIEIGNVELTPAAHAPSSGSRPAVSQGAGKQPITDEPPELEFGGSLAASDDQPESGRSGDAPLLEFLVAKAGLLDQEQAGRARATAVGEDIPVDQACTRLGLIDEEQLVNALTQECWVPHLKVDKYEIRKKALDTICEEDARAYSVLPVDKLGSILNLAMVNPLDVEAIRMLESKTGLDIKKVVATRSEIAQGIERYYGGGAGIEGGLDIQQDHDSRRVTQMLGRGSEAAPAPVEPSASEPAGVPEGSGRDDTEEVADIDDLLSGDEAVQPSIIEPITISDDELEPDVEEDDLEVIESPTRAHAAPAASRQDVSPDDTPVDEPSIAAPPEDAIEAVPESAIEEPAESTTDASEPSIGSPAESTAEASEPSIGPPEQPAASEPSIGPPAPPEQPVGSEPSPEPVPAAASTSEPAARSAPTSSDQGSAVVDLVPVMEEEFQHAITHGKARIFQKWTSLQTRNRILNAVMVESELDPLLHEVYAHGQRIAV